VSSIVQRSTKAKYFGNFAAGFKGLRSKGAPQFDHRRTAGGHENVQGGDYSASLVSDRAGNRAYTDDPFIITHFISASSNLVEHLE
jgi:hypothetical protein